MRPYENAEQDVVTSAPDLESIPAGADLDATWDGHADDDADGERHRATLSAELLTLYRRNARLEILLGVAEQRADAALREASIQAEAHRGALAGLTEARARIASLEADLAAERERASACVLRGLDAVHIDDLLAAVERRGLPRPVPAASVLICRDQAGDHTREDAAE